MRQVRSTKGWRQSLQHRAVPATSSRGKVASTVGRCTDPGSSPGPASLWHPVVHPLPRRGTRRCSRGYAALSARKPPSLQATLLLLFSSRRTLRQPTPRALEFFPCSTASAPPLCRTSSLPDTSTLLGVSETPFHTLLASRHRRLLPGLPRRRPARPFFSLMPTYIVHTCMPTW